MNAGDTAVDRRIAINTFRRSFALTHVTAIAENVTNNLGDFAIGIVAEGTSRLTAVTARADAMGGTRATGIQVQNTTTTNFVKMVNVTTNGTGATTNQGLLIAGGNSLSARNSVFSGSTAAVENGGVARLAATQLDGPTGGTGIYFCAAAYDTSFAVLGASC